VLPTLNLNQRVARLEQITSANQKLYNRLQNVQSNLNVNQHLMADQKRQYHKQRIAKFKAGKPRLDPLLESHRKHEALNTSAKKQSIYSQSVMRKSIERDRQVQLTQSDMPESIPMKAVAPANAKLHATEYTPQGFHSVPTKTKHIRSGTTGEQWRQKPDIDQLA